MLGQRKWLSGTLMDVEQTWLSMMPPLMLLDFMIWTSLFSLQSQLILAVGIIFSVSAYQFRSDILSGSNLQYP
uniref:Uncharacterized protein n=1 Tax=Aegilops tauschii subsp. strangulata TaxID=200361 RepID=A0A453AN25_AEGTS